MAEHENPARNPWLVAGWPGIGGVSIAAVAYLVDTLDMELVYEIPSQDFFETDHVEVVGGIARKPRLPRSRVFRWKNPDQDGRDLFVFAGEAQPQTRGEELCRRIAEFARAQGVRRIITFAALASQSEPTMDPRVHAAVTDPALVAEIRQAGLLTLDEGQIGGLNGVLLAAALEQRIPAMSLLAEMPFFATGVPNLQSSRAVLNAFSRLSGILFDMEGMNTRAAAVLEALQELMERLQQQADQERRPAEPGAPEPEAHAAEDEEPADRATKLSDADRRRIEQLFQAARSDRAQAAELKKELDRLGVFDEFEDRFLDLFKRAE